MKYVFFDIECANSYNNVAKMYSFGYVITDEDFNILHQPEDILINPDSGFNPYIRKNILAYDKKALSGMPKFDKVYPEICKILTGDDVLCFGYGIENDLHFLSDSCKRYHLDTPFVNGFDIQKLIEITAERQPKNLEQEYFEYTGKTQSNIHRSDIDALATAEIAQAISRAYGKRLHEFFIEPNGDLKYLPEYYMYNGVLTRNPFEKAQWIWTKTEYDSDDYAEFVMQLPDSVKKGEKVVLRYSSDSAFAAYIGRRLVAFSQCADLPEHKYFDCKNITKECAESNSDKMLIKVWHYGENSANYIKADGGVIFELECDGKVVAFSSENTPSRVMTEYKNGYRKQISGQLGFSFLYDNRVEDFQYGNSILVKKPMVFHQRIRNGLTLLTRVNYTSHKTTNSLIIDLYGEICGFLDLDVTCKSEIKLTIAYGEHLLDGGHVRRLMGDRDFSVEVILKPGRNVYMNPFRRLAGRYLEVFAEYVGEQTTNEDGEQRINPLDELKIKHITLRPTVYQTMLKPRKFADPLIQKIYRVCIRTLKTCMHEHYEDCAWREQGLYSLDSRNQALCGYYAFLKYDYQRANIVLLSRGLRPDGLLSLTVPGGIDFPIPFFSLVYFQTVYEFIQHTGKVAILETIRPTLRKIYSTFESQICDNGLIARFSPAPYWNFYEWTDGLDSWQEDMENPQSRKKEQVFDAPLNLAFIIATEYYDKIFGGKHDLSKMRKAVKDRFFDKKRGEFFISDNNKNSSQLVTALAILADVGGKDDAKKMIDGNQIAASLSTKAYVYDALLKVGGYEKYIIDDIKTVYGRMLESGSSTVWETEKGAEDFGGAGSLCHGWSAIPVYYFAKLLGGDTARTNEGDLPTKKQSKHKLG